MASKVLCFILLSIVQFTIVSSNNVHGRSQQQQGVAPAQGTQGIEIPVEGANAAASAISEAGSPTNNLNGKEQVIGNQNVGYYNNYGRNPVNTAAPGYGYNGYTQQEAAVYSAPAQPVFGLSSNGDISLSAYFGPAFWGCLTGVVAVVLIIWLLNTLGGFQLLGDAFRGISKSDKSGKSIDLDKLSAMVYTAIDQYGKWKHTPNNKYS